MITNILSILEIEFNEVVSPGPINQPKIDDKKRNFSRLKIELKKECFTEDIIKDIIDMLEIPKVEASEIKSAELLVEVLEKKGLIQPGNVQPLIDEIDNSHPYIKNNLQKVRIKLENYQKQAARYKLN